MIFLRIFKHLLPRARAWQITANKNLRKFFQGLADSGEDVKFFVDEVWQNIFPKSTQEVELFEDQFNLSNPTGLTFLQRRDRILAAWRALGGQDPRYIQDTLQANGFDVYIHEWWEPGTEPAIGVNACATPRNPSNVIYDPDFMWTMGNPLINMGNGITNMGGLNPTIVGYLLANNAQMACFNTPNTMGNPQITMGNNATMGQVLGITFKRIPVQIPQDSDKWKYILYIGGANFGEIAEIPVQRRNEFETLCLKICPAQQWLGIIVRYI